MKRFLAIIASLVSGFSFSQPLMLHPDNPKYFIYHGKPVAFITSAEHYGSVVNPDFDFAAYLNALETYGFNYTRIFAGAYLEDEEFGIRKNTLDLADRTSLEWQKKIAEIIRDEESVSGRMEPPVSVPCLLRRIGLC